ncbi:MAG: adenylate/guanylate cyclase domain-containing response regulator [Planctomycetota bacterium]|nr:MAG: adenylate/guanylate cyclase domain-containing response regulator [Planctomycetota bacterium]REJ93622.1 MAG: adenylate/guanylate cyclase domain-containing response regulator [Planctomycetota bacterium]REK30747.1 MAG: adenylate/guanylate cyclase domain-containing response regulator [Planctomycetota bacterium]REK33122.1 MAG: adenylate/guanylate cyclase domain-containing response regulator [Planctomycetota bacterium]
MAERVTERSSEKPAPPETDAPRTANVKGRKQLLRTMRKEMLPAVESIAGYTQMLRNDAADRPPEILADLDKLEAVATELYEFIKEEVTPNWPEVGSDQFAERLKTTRHEVGNRLNHALGYCQFLIMEERERFFGALAGDLETIQRFCQNCNALLLRFKGLADEPDAPAAPDDLSDARRAVEPHFAHASDAHPVEPARILVVDDSSETCLLLTKFLEREEHTVETAQNGHSALEALSTSEFDLVLLDFMMPGLSGFEVLQQIKCDERLRATPVIMISALDAVSDMVPCIEAGAEDYLTKPVDFALLKARVNASLERMRLREQEFGRHFTPELARHLLRNPDLVREGRDVDVTVLFCDIRGFSGLSERLGPAETVRWLGDVMAVLSDCVLSYHGVLVDYIGDELMAMWGAPQEIENHAELACRAAFDMLARLPELNERWQHVIDAETDLGIGLNSGVARVGNTGSIRKFKYGPLGNTVNLASRVQGATKYLSSRLLLTGGTHQRLAAHFPSRRLCQVRVVNIQEAVELYELLTPGESNVTDLAERYERALNDFEQQRLPQAAATLGNLLVDDPCDGPSLMLMSRVVDRLLHSEGDFDPVWDLPGK